MGKGGREVGERNDKGEKVLREKEEQKMENRSEKVETEFPF